MSGKTRRGFPDCLIVLLEIVVLSGFYGWAPVYKCIRCFSYLRKWFVAHAAGYQLTVTAEKGFDNVQIEMVINRMHLLKRQNLRVVSFLKN